MTWFRLPLFVWAHYATSLIMILGTPVIAITVLLVAVERGAAPRHLRPGARRRPGPLPAPVLVLLAPGGLHHDPAGDGRDQRDRRRRSRARTSSATRSSRSRAWRSRSSASSSGAITCSSPASRSTPGWSSRSSASSSRSRRRSRSSTGRRRSTRARCRCDSPMLYAFGFIGLFTIGGLTGLFLAALGLDIHVHDTYFVVAHFHYIMVGGAIMGYLGGLHYWWPKITGRHVSRGLGEVRRRCMIFVGFNLTFFPQFILGYLGHAAPLSRVSAGVPGAERAVDRRRVDPRRRLPVADDLLHRGRCSRASTLAGRIRGARKGLEWEIPSPPPTENFAVTPIVTARHAPVRARARRSALSDGHACEHYPGRCTGRRCTPTAAARRTRTRAPSEAAAPLRQHGAAGRGVDARHVGVPGHRNHVLRRPVHGLPGLPASVAGRRSRKPAITSTSSGARSTRPS